MIRLAPVLAPLIVALLAAAPAVAALPAEPAEAGVVALLAAAPTVGAPPSKPAPSSAPEPAPARLQRGFLRVEGLPRPELVEALALRVPHLAFEPFEAAAGAELGEGAAFVDLRAVPGTPRPEAFTLTIVVSDGRAFDRQVQAAADDEETVRLLASTVANLLLAIEAGTVQADRGDVPLPAPVAEPVLPCACDCPAAPSCPLTPAAEPAVVPSPLASRSPRIELAPSLSLLMITGLGEPAAADRFAGLGGSVGVHARLRSGAFLGLGLRTAGRGEPAGTRVLRQRFALGGGYELRRDGWALEASLWGTVEPWWLLGAPIDPAPRPQWGVVARLAPSFHRARLAGGRMGLSVGPMIELGASASLGGGRPGIGLVVVSDGESVRSRQRVGGLELSTGLAATLWFGVR